MSGGNLMNTWNQFLAFSPLYAATIPAESVFWPGCAAMKLAPELLLQTYQALKREQPGMGFSSLCCAKPTNAVGSDAQKQKRRDQLSACFAKTRIRRVYTLCPNCLLALGKYPEIEVLPAWPLLAQHAEHTPLAASLFPQEYILHDPCAAREDAASHDAARRILAARQIPHTEFAHCRAQARCCGRRDMLFLTNPAASKKMLDTRLAETNGLPIVTYCESCVESFRAAGHTSVHLLEVLFNAPAHRGITNRLKNAHRKDFYA